MKEFISVGITKRHAMRVILIGLMIQKGVYENYLVFYKMQLWRGSLSLSLFVLKIVLWILSFCSGYWFQIWWFWLKTYFLRITESIRISVHNDIWQLSKLNFTGAHTWFCWYCLNFYSVSWEASSLMMNLLFHKKHMKNETIPNSIIDEYEIKINSDFVEYNKYIGRYWKIPLFRFVVFLWLSLRKRKTSQQCE
jgi:hypothetical protein